MRLVHHVEHENHRQRRRGELRGQHQRTAQISRVGNLDDEFGAAAREQLPGNAFVLAQHALEGVHTRRVDNVAHLGADQRPSTGDRDRGAGIVGDSRVTASQPAKHYTLADIRIAHERDFEGMRAKPKDRGLSG